MSIDDQAELTPHDGTGETMAAVHDWLEAHELTLDASAVKRFSQVYKELTGRYDDDRLRDAALLAAARYLAGEVTPSEVGKTLARARAKADEQLAIARTVATLAVSDGEAESVTAREIGVDRMALRKWLGKK
jgi:hypothetical protein